MEQIFQRMGDWFFLREDKAAKNYPDVVSCGYNVKRAR